MDNKTNLFNDLVLLEEFVNDAVVHLVPEKEFKELFGFIQDPLTLHRIYIRAKYQAKQNFLLYFSTHGDSLVALKNTLIQSKRDNKIHNTIVAFSKTNTTQLPTEEVHKICLEAVGNVKEKMEIEKSPASQNDQIFTLLSDTLQVSEKVNSLVTEKYFPVDKYDTLV
ncbi:hypothetical protein EIN_278180 [Entamoeba invadens IP1]|uniref:Uncharacterized protein n=1 Tax=Entamoeba invadens IP1 TaxID=370355 RepID=A0A0A1U0D3_ENTIV|nr:hypothetical protein EIN_278180 [Entamoeba invadens IP1]ELP84348.1 hypothetical protein EIN_278180 [Entamoeba invadens IP1]|eukprot:XP_004183694.1 hypothetical protein EIN_278180 [Entamoeba invadens IP1]